MKRRRARACRIAHSAAALALATGLLASQPLRAQQADENAAPPAAEPAGSQPSSSTETPAEAQPSANAQQPMEGTGGVEGLSRAREIPPDAFGSQQQTGIPYSSVMVPTGADVGTFYPFRTDPFQREVSDTTKIGQAEGSVSVLQTGGSLSLPFLKAGGEPDNADIKLGPLYFKFDSLDMELLYDDNFRRASTDRTSSTLLLLELNMTVTAQLSDDVQFSMGGGLGYLPLQGQFGFQSGLYSSLVAGILAGPLLATQFVYDTVIASWPVRFADDFRIVQGQYSDSLGDNFNLFRGDILQRDQEGNYSFRSGYIPARDTPENGNRTFNDSFFAFVNSLSAVTTRELPNQIVFTARVEHDNLWYNQQNRGLPTERDDLLLNAVSDRENLRFKPYLTYEVAYVSDIPGVFQIIRAGIFGPITDQLFLWADAGYFTSGNRSSALYDLTLSHDAGPNTTETLSLFRSLTNFNQELVTGEYYRIQQTLGPTIEARAFAAHTSSQELVTAGQANRDDTLGGVELSWFIGPKTNMSLGAIYEDQRYSGGGRNDTFTGRATLNRTITDSLSFQLLYQYQHTTSNISGSGYYENLVFLRIVKLFN